MGIARAFCRKLQILNACAKNFGRWSPARVTAAYTSREGDDYTMSPHLFRCNDGPQSEVPGQISIEEYMKETHHENN